MSNVMKPLTEKQIGKLHPITKKAFEVHYPDYEFKTYKPAYGDRMFYVVPKDSKNDWSEHVCQLSSIEEVNGYMHGALKAITGMMVHNKNWEQDLMSAVRQKEFVNDAKGDK